MNPSRIKSTMQSHAHNSPILLVTCLAMLIAGTACVNRVIPPARPTDPTSVFLLDHGRHPSLVIPRKENEWVRYTYGNWAWYAEGRTHVFKALAALCWPNKAALGQQRLAPADDLFHPAGPIGEGIVRVYSIHVSAERARRLDDRLEELFMAGREEKLYNPEWGVEFVPHPRAYWIFYQSNTVVAEWLEEMGCEVRGPALFSKWKIPERPPGPESPPTD